VRSASRSSAAGQVPRRYSFARYLSAKASVDDRALNGHVWDTLQQAVAVLGGDGGMTVVELGSGIGTMVERLLARRLLSGFTYRGIEAQPRLARHAARRLSAWGRKHGYSVAGLPDKVVLRREAEIFRLSFPAADALQVARRKRQTADLLMAHAFLDLLDLPTAVPALLGMLRPGGLFYFTINFDGATLLEPLVDPVFDDLVQQLYHRTMDERITGGAASGDSRAGRHLFAHLIQAQAEILDAGASDWVVFPQAGRYPADEAYFLHFILHTLYTALRGHPELDTRRFEAWTARRHQQVEQGELVYIAHQIDFVGKYPQSRVGD